MYCGEIYKQTRLTFNYSGRDHQQNIMRASWLWVGNDGSISKDILQKHMNILGYKPNYVLSKKSKTMNEVKKTNYVLNSKAKLCTIGKKNMY